jgi:preprotein translocase subunit SecG
MLMLKIFGFQISILLIGIIFLRMPQESMGLASFATKSDLLGSPSSAERSLNILTAFGIFLFLGIAIQLNFINQ